MIVSWYELRSSRQRKESDLKEKELQKQRVKFDMKKFVESQIDQMNIDNLHDVIIELVSSNKKLTDMADKMRQKCLDYSYREASLKR